MLPPVAAAVPLFILFKYLNLLDSLFALIIVYTAFNIPFAVWILEGFMSAVPKELDETAYVDGYSFGRFFFKIFVPTIAAGIGITMFFCFMFSWVELLLAKTLTATAAGTSNSLGWKTTSTQSVQIDLPTYETANVTFTVDMRNANLADGDKVNINGTFNGWCGECNPMTDDDSDGIYNITMPLTTNTMYELSLIHI